MTLTLDRGLRALDLDLTILEAEATVRDLEKARGLIPAQATRPMTEAEIRSHCDFAGMDATTTRAYQETAAALRPLRMAILAALEETARNAPTPEALAKAVLGFAANQPAPVRSAVRVAESRIARVLTDLHGEAGQALAREARAQGVDRTVATDAVPTDYEVAAAKAPAALWASLSAAAVTAVATRSAVTQAKAGELDRVATLDDLLTTVRGQSAAVAEDLARQEVNIAHGEGRADAVAQLPTPTAVYASELLDGATCSKCEKVDGREYATVEAANEDYPSDGPFRDCKGGDRCRGTLVYVWGEAPATVDDNPLTPAPPPPAPDTALPQELDYPQPAPGKSTPESMTPGQLRSVPEDDLVDALNRAYLDDSPAADMLEAELNRRQAAADRATRRRERRAEIGNAKLGRINDLIDQGWDPYDAVHEITGVTVTAQKRSEAISVLRGLGYDGKGFDQLAAQYYRDQAEAAYLAAEQATRTHLRNKLGVAKDIDERSLFRGPDANARKYASPELLEWWDNNGRVTLESVKDQLMGQSRAYAGEDFLR